MKPAQHGSYVGRLGLRLALRMACHPCHRRDTQRLKGTAVRSGTKMPIAFDLHHDRGRNRAESAACREVRERNASKLGARDASSMRLQSQSRWRDVDDYVVAAERMSRMLKLSSHFENAIDILTDQCDEVGQRVAIRNDRRAGWATSSRDCGCSRSHSGAMWMIMLQQRSERHAR